MKTLQTEILQMKISYMYSMQMERLTFDMNMNIIACECKFNLQIYNDLFLPNWEQAHINRILV